MTQLNNFVLSPLTLPMLRLLSSNAQGRTFSLPMLRLLSSNAQGLKDIRKPSKPCHVGIHWIALTEYCQMRTHVPGFQSFFSFFASFCIGQISHQQHFQIDHSNKYLSMKIPFSRRQENILIRVLISVLVLPTLVVDVHVYLVCCRIL